MGPCITPLPSLVIPLAPATRAKQRQLSQVLPRHRRGGGSGGTTGSSIIHMHPNTYETSRNFNLPILSIFINFYQFSSSSGHPDRQAQRGLVPTDVSPSCRLSTDGGVPPLGGPWPPGLRFAKAFAAFGLPGPYGLPPTTPVFERGPRALRSAHRGVGFP